MTNCTTSQAQKEAFIAQMTQRMAEVAQKMSDWVTAEPRTLEETEKMTLKAIKELGDVPLASLIRLNVPAYPEEKEPCPCGQTADYQCMRPAHVDTLRARALKGEAFSRALAGRISPWHDSSQRGSGYRRGAHWIWDPSG